MKHITCVTRKPQTAQSTIETMINFLVTLVDQAITFFYQKQSTL
jgi:hypothetical protein